MYNDLLVMYSDAGPGRAGPGWAGPGGRARGEGEARAQKGTQGSTPACGGVVGKVQASGAARSATT